MSNDQWGTNPNPPQGQPSWNQQQPGQQPASQPSAGAPGAGQPRSQHSAWEDTDWLPGSWQGSAASANPPAGQPSAAGSPLGQYQSQPTAPQQPSSQQWGTSSGWGAPGQQPPAQATQGGQGWSSYPAQQWDTAPTQQWGQPVTPEAAREGGVGGFFRALFDFSFEHFVTPAIVKAVYLISVVLVGLTWLGWVLGGFAAGDAGTALGLVALLLGWIPALFVLAMLRITLEYMVATVRTSEEARAIRETVTKDAPEA